MAQQAKDTLRPHPTHLGPNRHQNVASMLCFINLILRKIR